MVICNPMVQSFILFVIKSHSLGSCSCLTTTVGTVAVGGVVSAELLVFVVTVTGGCTIFASAGLIVLAAIAELIG